MSVKSRKQNKTTYFRTRTWLFGFLWFLPMWRNLVCCSIFDYTTSGNPQFWVGPRQRDMCAEGLLAGLWRALICLVIIAKYAKKVPILFSFLSFPRVPLTTPWLVCPGCVCVGFPYQLQRHKQTKKSYVKLLHRDENTGKKDMLQIRRAHKLPQWDAKQMQGFNFREMKNKLTLHRYTDALQLQTPAKYIKDAESNDYKGGQNDL